MCQITRPNSRLHSVTATWHSLALIVDFPLSTFGEGELLQLLKNGTICVVQVVKNR